MKKTMMVGAAAIALAVAAPSFAQDRTAPGTPGTKPPVAADRTPDKAARERIARLIAAEPAEKIAVSGDALIGTEVRNTEDKKIGSVKDIILAEGKITAIVIARGGVLGMGTDYHQLDFSQVKMTADAETVVVDLSEDQVKALPKLAYEDGKWGPTKAAADRDRVSPPRTAPGAPPSRTETPAPKTDMKKDDSPKTDTPAPKEQ